VDKPDQDLLNKIQTHGWAVIRVSGEDGPDFAYSIGLYEKFGQPEIIILGLKPDTAHKLINDVGEAMGQGIVVRAGETSDAFLDSFRCTFRRVPPHQYRAYLGRALWYYKDRAFPALQFIYPDRHGRWPWEEGVHADFRRTQPVLADEPEPPWASDSAV
jgi:hypothetical protein